MAAESQDMGGYAADVQGVEGLLEVSAAARTAVREATGEIASAMSEGGDNKVAITRADDFIAGFMGVRNVFLSSLGPPPSQNILLHIFHALSALFFSSRPTTQTLGWTSRSAPRTT